MFNELETHKEAVCVISVVFRRRSVAKFETEVLKI